MKLYCKIVERDYRWSWILFDVKRPDPLYSVGISKPYKGYVANWNMNCDEEDSNYYKRLLNARLVKRMFCRTP